MAKKSTGLAARVKALEKMIAGLFSSAKAEPKKPARKKAKKSKKAKKKTKKSKAAA